MRRWIARVRLGGAVALTCGATLIAGGQGPRRVTVDDLMGLRTINDVEMSPSGDRIAYVVSTPSVVSNNHEPALFVIPTDGGNPTRLASETRIFVPALPAPRLRWAPDGTRISFLALAGNRRQVFVVDVAGGPAQSLTSAPEGVSGYEWSADGRWLAFLTRDGSPLPPVANRVGAQPPATRLSIQSSDSPSTARVLTPCHSVRRQLFVVAGWPRDRVLLCAVQRIPGAVFGPDFCRSSCRGAARTIVDRPGMNIMPQFSPDGRQIAFVTTNGETGIIAPRGLAVAPATGGDRSRIRSYPMNGAWIGEMIWAPDSQSLFVMMNEGTFATGGQMFEMPIVRVSIDERPGEARCPRPRRELLDEREPRRPHDWRIAPSKRARWATSSCTTSPRGTRTTLTDVNPELSTLCARRAEADQLAVVRRHGDLGPAADAPGCGRQARSCRSSSTATAGRSAASPTASSRSSCTRRVRSIRIRPKRWPAPATPCCFRCRAAAPDTAKRATARSSTPGARPTTRTSWPASIT